MRVPRQDQPLARHVFRDCEGAQARDRRRRRVEPPCPVEAPLVERRLERVPRQNPEVVEQPQTRRKGGRQGDYHRLGIGRRRRNGLALDAQARVEHAFCARVVGRAKRKHHVGRRERHAVREHDSASQREREGPMVCRLRPSFGEPWLELVGRAVDSHERRLRQNRKDIEGRRRFDVAIEGRGFAANRPDQRAAADATARPGRVRRIRWRSPARGANGQHGDARRQRRDAPKNPRIRGHSWSRRPIAWPTSTSQFAAVSVGNTYPHETGDAGQPTHWLSQMIFSAGVSRDGSAGCKEEQRSLSMMSYRGR